MKIENLRKEVVEGSNAVVFDLVDNSGVRFSDQLEWLDSKGGVEFTDSHLKCHCEADVDIYELLELLESKIS